jgi:hypothetical protein
MEEFRRRLCRVFRHIASYLEEGQRRGVFRKELNKGRRKMLFMHWTMATNWIISKRSYKLAHGRFSHGCLLNRVKLQISVESPRKHSARPERVPLTDGERQPCRGLPPGPARTSKPDTLNYQRDGSWHSLSAAACSGARRILPGTLSLEKVKTIACHSFRKPRGMWRTGMHLRGGSVPIYPT